MTVKEVVDGFFGAINEGNMEGAMQYMDKNHEYTGPMFNSKGPEEYMKFLGAFGMEFEVETQDMIYSENGVTHAALLKVLSPVYAEIPTCEIIDVKNDKIIRQRFYFDTKLFPNTEK